MSLRKTRHTAGRLAIAVSLLIIALALAVTIFKYSQNSQDVKHDSASLRMALFDAIASEDVESIRHQLTLGCDVNTKDGGGYTPLLRAVANPSISIEVIELLLAHGADVTPTVPPDAPTSNNFVVSGANAILLAVLNGREDLVRLVASNGGDVDAAIHNEHLDTPLIAAIVSDDAKMVRLLLDLGAKVDGGAHLDSYGSTALYVAACISSPEVVEVLLDRGADPHAAHRWTGLLPIEAAAKRSDPPEAVINLLRSRM